MRTAGFMIYLYSGFAPDSGFLRTVMGMRGKSGWSLWHGTGKRYAYIEGEPVMVAPGPLFASGTGFEGHAFYEASSMRRIHGKILFCVFF